MKPTSRNRQPVFDKFQEEGFIAAGHNPWKVARWAFALLFGGYKQGKGTLENAQTGAFCCLGVMGKTFGAQREVICEWGQEKVLYDREQGVLNPGKYLGGDLYAFNSMEDDAYPDFSEANDNRDVTFREIAFFLLGTLLPWKR